jgi:hypothetical protein
MSPEVEAVLAEAAARRVERLRQRRELREQQRTARAEARAHGLPARHAAKLEHLGAPTSA